MKKLLLVLVALVLLIAGGFGYVAMNANSLIARYTPELEAIASSALKTKVTLGSVSTTVFPSVRVNVSNVSVGGANGLSLNDLTLRLKLMPLLSKKLVISELSLDRPEITIRKTAAGVTIVGLPSTPPADKNAPSAAPAPKQSAAPASSDAAPASPLDVSLEAVAITNGKFTFDDTTTKQQHTISDFNLRAAVALAGSTITLPTLTIDAKVLDGAPLNISLTEVKLDNTTQQLSAPNIAISLAELSLNASADLQLTTTTGTATVRSTGLSIPAALRLARRIQPLPPELNLTGDLIPNITASLKGSDIAVRGTIGLKTLGVTSGATTISNLNGQIELDGNNKVNRLRSTDLKFEGNGQPFAVNFEVTQSPEEVTLRSLSVNAFGGEVLAQGGLTLGNQNFRATTKLTAIDLGAAAAFAAPAAAGAIAGKLSAAEIGVSGALGANLMPSLRGQGNLAVRDATITGINLAGEVLNAVKGLPFLSGSLAEALSGSGVDISGNKTALQNLDTTFGIGDNALNITKLAAVSPLFNLDSTGPVQFSGAMNLRSEIAFSPTVSKALAGRVKELGALMNSEGRFVVPLVIAGQPGAIKVLPNIERLVELGAKNALKQKAGDLLGKALGGSKQKGGALGGLGGVLGF